MPTQRKVGGRTEFDAVWNQLNGLVLATLFSVLDPPGLANGTTPGQLQTGNNVDYRIGPASKYTKAATDDLFDLSGEADTDAASYRAYWLYLDDAGVASVAAGEDRSSEALALAALPAPSGGLSIVGVYVAGPSTDFDDAGGLTGQGTVHEGLPAGVPGVASLPDFTALVAP